MKTLNTDVDFNLDFGNFDPEAIEVDETINAVFIVDTSYSIKYFVKDLNYAFNEFTESMQKSHVADRLFVSVIEFNSAITNKQGFQPITAIQPMDFSRKISGNTALYDAVSAGLENALKYRENLENSGVETKTLLFVITDGDDNNSKIAPATIRRKLKSLKKDEHSAFSFTSILFGIGDSGNFGQAKNAMGFDHLAQLGTTGAELKKMVGFISQSISSISSGQGVAAPKF